MNLCSLSLWDNHSIIHFEFLNHNQTLNADLYSQQLQYVHENVHENLQENALHSSVEEMLSFSMIRQGHIL